MTIAHIVFVPPPPPVPGLRITSHRGTITASTSKALTGQAITSAKGTLVPLKTGLPVTGQQILSNQGAIGLTISTGSLPLAGKVITSTRGSITPMRPIVGLKSTSAKGTVGKQRTHALTGQAITTRLGSPVTLNITDTSVPDAQVGVPYSYTFHVVGYSALNNLLWALDAASPNTGGWLSITHQPGNVAATMSGTPTIGETENITVGVGDTASTGPQFDKSFTFNVTGTTFPLLGGYLIAGSVQSAWTTGAFQQSVARLGVAVIGTATFTANASANNSAAAAVKAINPSIKLYQYTNIMEFQSWVNSGATAPWGALWTLVNTWNWFTRNPWPAGAIVDVDGLSQQGLNLTTFTSTASSGAASGKNYIQYRAGWSAANEYGANWDGIYLDNVSQGNNNTGNVDLRQTGTSVAANSTTAKQDFRSGYAAYLPLLRAALPAGATVIGNTGDWGNSPLTGYVGILDGGVMEHIIGQSYSWEAQGWLTMMNNYKTVMNSINAPKYLIFSQDAANTNYAGMRYGLCSCLLDNAYYANSHNNALDSVTWLDEFGFNLGAASAGSQGLAYSAGLTVYQNGVWRRDFTNGIVLVNPRGNRPNGTVANVTLPIDVWRLRASTYGNQDPAVNSGAKITAGATIAMPDAGAAGTGGSGLILSRTAT